MCPACGSGGVRAPPRGTEVRCYRGAQFCLRNIKYRKNRREAGRIPQPPAGIFCFQQRSILPRWASAKCPGQGQCRGAPLGRMPTLLGGASIVSGYTPSAFAGAMPRHLLSLKGCESAIQKEGATSNKHRQDSAQQIILSGFAEALQETAERRQGGTGGGAENSFPRYETPECQVQDTNYSNF